MHMQVFLSPKRCRSFLILLPIILFFSSCATSKIAYNPAMKIAPAKLREDLSLAKKILEVRQPGLYEYVSKDSLDAYYNATLESISDSLTEFSFRKKLAWYISKIRSGHTTVRPSKKYTQYAEMHDTKRFPLALKVWKDSMVVVYNFSKNDSVLKRGTIITSINGNENIFTIDSIFQFLSSDGYANNFKYQMLSKNFSLFYSFAFPNADFYRFGYIDSAGNENFITTPAYKPIRDTSSKAHIEKPVRKIKKVPAKIRRQRYLFNKRTLEFDSSSNTAYVRVSTFSGGKLRPFFRKSFKEISKKNIQNLVVDVRDNTGGKVSLSILLAKYLINAPFNFADTVVANTHTFKYGKYLHPQYIYDIAALFTSRKKKDGLYHFSFLEKHEFKPRSSNNFHGNIYILQDGFTFSAGSLFVSKLKGQDNVQVIGEESGGGNEGTSAIYLPEIILPNSKLRVILPMFRIVENSNKPATAKGIVPDIEVQPSSRAIRDGIDLKIKKVKALIAETQKNNSINLK